MTDGHMAPEMCCCGQFRRDDCHGPSDGPRNDDVPKAVSASGPWFMAVW